MPYGPNDVLDALCMVEWQPIETAPKDGTLILIYAMSRNERECRFIDTAFFTDEKTWDGLDMWFCGTSSHPATHWMPLPEPPK